MEPSECSKIPAASRRQAMDWGLVLLSQGIAAVLDDGLDGTGWGLLVTPAEYPDALRAIQLYRLENRHWQWRRPVAWLGFVFDWKVLFWAVLLVAAYVPPHSVRPGIQAAGCMDNAAVASGQWWRLFTAMLLHADIAHLASNVTFGIILLGLAMGRYGSGLGLLLCYLAGAAGNAAGWLLYPPSHLGVGASGMVMGGLGLLAVQSLKLLRQNPISRKYVIRALVAGLLLFVLFGLSPGTDIVAHFGGFVAGLILGGMVISLPRRWQNRKVNGACGIILCGLFAATCWLAFH